MYNATKIKQEERTNEVKQPNRNLTGLPGGPGLPKFPEGPLFPLKKY